MIVIQYDIKLCNNKNSKNNKNNNTKDYSVQSLYGLRVRAEGLDLIDVKPLSEDDAFVLP